MQQVYRINYLPAALRDLELTAQRYLELVGAASAEAIVSEILDTVDLLRTFPYSGPLHPDPVLAERSYRKILCRSFVCVYKVMEDEKAVYIYRIVDGRTDYPKLLH